MVDHTHLLYKGLHPSGATAGSSNEKLMGSFSFKQLIHASCNASHAVITYAIILSAIAFFDGTYYSFYS